MDKPVKYIGRRAIYTDYVHGSKLTFTSGQVRNLPGDLARKMLRQTDIFEPREAEPGEVKDAKAAESRTDDTEKVLLEMKKQKDDIAEKDNERNALIDQIRTMEKSQLGILANDRWGQKLHHKLSLESARAKVLQFVDQYGAA